MITTALIILLAIEAVLILAFMVAETAYPAFISFLVVLLIAHFGLDAPFLTAILADVPLAIGIFAAYLGAGAVYSIVRWWFRVRRAAVKMGKIKKSVQADGEWNQANPNSAYRHQAERTDAAGHKALITGWIAFWPVDALALSFEEPLTLLYEWLSSTYDRITESALKAQGLD